MIKDIIVFLFNLQLFQIIIGAIAVYSFVQFIIKLVNDKSFKAGVKTYIGTFLLGSTAIFIVSFIICAVFYLIGGFFGSLLT